MKKVIKPTKVLEHVKNIELSEDGAVVTLTTPNQKIFLDRDQIMQLWGTLTLAIDLALLGQLSGKIRRVGLWNLIHDSMQGAKILLVDERQLNLPSVGVNESPEP